MLAAMRLSDQSDAGFGVYVHWPFCLAKCPYCDFNSHVREAVDQARWRRALLAELDHFAALTPGRRVESLFFGGGTPSLMPPETVAAVIDRVRHHWISVPALEITLEANPTSVEAGRFQGFAQAGVNRVSLGVQALVDDALAFLGRRHSAAEALEALELARRYFARFSFDLIYARPGQTIAAWENELSRALEQAADHLSLYQLTIEPNTGFASLHRQGALVLPDEDLAADLYETTQAVMTKAGLPAYEISNHARPGAECRHNLIYWRGGEWVGVGPGAHGRLALADGFVATRQARAPEAWLDDVEARGHATRERQPILPSERAEELLMMGLRLAEGVDRARFERQTGQPLDRHLKADRLQALVADGLMVDDGKRLGATEAGRQRLDAVLAALLA
ncbi:MAG: coproporphyrinogen III oxidase [Alphaproteobacteria bacterium]|nr:coproporphyrinogen III oxidase [Alphaproteobacteria bacterium]